jgi:hypothetical protein
VIHFAIFSRMVNANVGTKSFPDAESVLEEAMNTVRFFRTDPLIREGFLFVRKLISFLPSTADSNSLFFQHLGISAADIWLSCTHDRSRGGIDRSIESEAAVKESGTLIWFMATSLL